MHVEYFMRDFDMNSVFSLQERQLKLSGFMLIDSRLWVVCFRNVIYLEISIERV